MELDDLKSIEKAPGLTGREGSPVSPQGLDGLIEELKAADAKGRKTIVQFSVFIITMFVIYITVATSRDGGSGLGYRILAGGFFLILLYFYWLYRMLRKIDYAEPVMKFLKKAERRYSFMNPTDWFIVGPLLAILGTGGGFIVHYTFLKYFDNVTIPLAIYITFFISVVLFGFWASKKNWKKDKGEILNRIKKMRLELE
jgi:hypothetical protein